MQDKLTTTSSNNSSFSDQLGPSARVIERDGLMFLKIDRRSWRRTLSYEIVIGPRRIG